MTKSKAQKQQEAAEAARANTTGTEVVLPTDGEVLPQIEGEVDGQVVNLDSKTKAAPKAEKTAEELAAEAAAKAEKEAAAAKLKAEKEQVVLGLEAEVETAAEEADKANDALKQLREKLKLAKADLNGKTVAAPSPRTEGKGVIEMILDLWNSGMTRPQIIKAGYNKSTVQRQVGEYINKQKAAGQPIQANAPVAATPAAPVVEAENAEVTAEDVV